MADTVIIEVDLNVSRSIQQMEQLKLEIKEQQALMKLYGKDTEEFKNAANKIYGMKEQLKILNTTTQQAVKQQSAIAGSMRDLGLQLETNRMKYRNLSEAERNNADIGGKLLATIQAQDAKLKQLDATLGNHQRNVGNYEKALQGMGNQFMTIFSAAGLANIATSALSSAFQGIKQWVSGATEAFTRQENAITKLKFAIDGNITLLEKYKARASEIQKQTVFGDEQILEVQAYASALQMGEERTNQLVNASIQLATVTGTDVMTAAQMLAKTLTGEVSRSLKVYVTETANLSKEQIKNGAVVDLVAEKYKGFAEAQALTSVGALQQLRNELSDVQEEMGEHTIKSEIYWEKLKGTLAKESLDIVKRVEIITSMFDGFSTEVEKNTKRLEQQKKAIAANIMAYAELTGQTREQILVSLKNATTQSEILRIYSEIVNSVQKQKDAVKELSDEEIKAAEASRKQRAAKLDELEKLRIELIQDAQEKEIALENKRYDDYVKQWGELEGAYQVHVNKLLAIDRSYNDLKRVEIIKNKEVQQQAFLETSTALTDAYEAQREAEIKSEEELSQKKIEIAKNEAEFKKSIASSVNNIVNTLMDIELIKAGENEEKKKQIRKKYANIQAATSAAMTVINTAEGITKALAELGPIAGVIASALVGATGLVELGIINAQRQEIQGLATGTPEVTKGGVFKVGEKGPEQVYLPTGAAVIPNSLIDFAPFTAAMPSQTGMAEMIINGIKNLRPVVTVEDINAAQLSEANRVKIGKI